MKHLKMSRASFINLCKIGATPILAALFLLTSAIVYAQTNGPYDLSWWTVDNGSDTFSGSGYTLDGTIGQPDAAVWQGGDYTLAGGFWHAAAPESHIYLPLVVRNYTAPVAIPVSVGNTIPSRPIAYQGEVFYTTSLRLPNALPPNGSFYFSSQQDTVAEAIVDDELAILLDEAEVFSYTFSTSATPPAPAIMQVPRATMEPLAGQTITIEYRDVYGSIVQASEMWLIWVP